MARDQSSAGDCCIDCKTPAPATDTDYTLISKTHNWRLERRWEHGALVLEWRCPRCWQHYKMRRASTR
jgi:hypothetical protein